MPWAANCWRYDVVELVAMPMPLGNDLPCRSSRGRPCCSESSVARLRAQPHRAALVGDRLLLVQQADHRVRRVLVELGGVGACPGRPRCRANSITAHCMPRQMPKNGMPRSRAKRIASTLPSMPRSPNPPGTSNAVVAGQQPLGAFALDRLRCGSARCGSGRDGAMPAWSSAS